MNHTKKLRCYRYIARPYAEVRDLLRDHAYDVFQLATNSAYDRATNLIATLSVSVGGLELGVDASVCVDDVREDAPVAGLEPITCVELRWEAARAAFLFPWMEAQLLVHPMSASETQVVLEGEYQPPLGSLGAAFNNVIGHRIAEASVHRFLDEVIAQLGRPAESFASR